MPDKPVIGEELAGFEEKWELDENNKLIPRKNPLSVVPALVEEVAASLMVSADVTELETYAIDALELLQNDDTAAAIVILRTALLERVSWCGCSPGKCEGDKFLGCRSKSPLVK